MKSILNYVDYREFLKDFFAEKKSCNIGYSLKVLSEKAGFKARDYILRVMNGKRNLSSSGINSLNKALKLSVKEQLYFEHLVFFNQGKTQEEKDHHFQILIGLRKGCKVEKILEEQYEYFSQYYHAALRSLLPVIDFNDNYDEIGRFFDPSLSAKQIRQSIDLLTKLGMITRDSSGKYKVINQAISTGDDVKQTGLAAFHKSSMQMALRSLDIHTADKRDISGVTFSISQNAFEQIRNEISLFRKKIMNIAHNDKNEDTVYQLNLQLFPLTHTRKK